MDFLVLIYPFVGLFLVLLELKYDLLSKQLIKFFSVKED